MDGGVSVGRKGGRKQVRKEWWRKVTEGGSREEIRGRVRGYYWKREISMVGNKKHGGGWLIWICTHAHMHTCTQLHTRLHAEIRRREAASPVQSWHIPYPVQ